MPSPRPRPQPLDLPPRSLSEAPFGAPVAEDKATDASPAAKKALDEEDEDERLHQQRMATKLRRATLVGIPETSAGERFPAISNFVRSNRFESVIGVAILLNTATIGMEVNAMVKGQSKLIENIILVSENLFTAFFLTEFILRVVFIGPQIYIPGFSGNVSLGDACWNLLDAGFVWITGIGIVWVAPLLQVDVGRLRILAVVRSIRLMRLVRVVRKMREFSEVYMLIRGLGDSMTTLFWTVLVIFGITYVFAIFGVVLISAPIKEIREDTIAGRDDEFDLATLDMLVEQTGSLDRWMYTLIQVMTLDSWTGISRPMDKVIPSAWVLLYLYIIVVAIVFMNLVTAVIVENALENSKADEEAQLVLKDEANRKLFKTFQQLFTMMDEDDDGTLTAEEFEHAFHTPELERKLKLLDFKYEECLALFQLLDEGDGTLTLEEFFYGLQQMKGKASAKEVYILRKNVDRIWQFLVQYTHEVDQDSKDLFNSIGSGACREHRKGDVLSRAQEASRKAHEMKHDSNQTGQLVSLAASRPQFDETDTSVVGPLQLSSQMRELIRHVDGVGTLLSSQVQTLTKRLESLEESSAATEQVAQQLISSAALPPEPKLKENQGLMLGPACCSVNRPT